MNKLRLLSVLSIFCLTAWGTAPVSAQVSHARQIPAGGTGTLTTSNGSFLNTGGPELDPGVASVPDHDGGNDAVGRVSINRRMPAAAGDKDARKHEIEGRHVAMPEGHRARHSLNLDASFDGLNFYQQRYADSGNQFSLEPPDQGLCAGNGYVLESVNDVLRVFSTGGSSVSGTVSLNQFYGYAPAINRSTGAYGPSITDPSCMYDRASKRWFHLVLTLDRVGTTSALAGTNHLDLAVSETADPLGVWTIYRIPVQDDGSDGTPNHNCPGGPCLGDYPHIGADKNGIYLTTNEFPLFASGYIGAQIYAISKEELAESSAHVTVFQYNTADASTQSASGLPGFTVWPSISAGESPSERGGTEYLLSSLAIFQDSGVDSRLQLWSLTNTKALGNGHAPTLSSSLVNTEAYGIPGYARQPGVGTNGVGQAPGGGNIEFPLGQCLNDANCATTYLLGFPDPYVETISPLAGNDSRMQQVYYADGKLWASLGTGLSFSEGGGYSDGLAYFILKPKPGDAIPTAKVSLQGYLGDPNLDMTYGTVGVTDAGRGIISFTATGLNNYPSVGYASLDDRTGAGEDLHYAAAGVGPNDGFTGYKIYGGNPRWGDYGATAVDGNKIWFAQEYIAQKCALNDYLHTPPVPLGTCNAKRGALGNWATHIAKVTP